MHVVPGDGILVPKKLLRTHQLITDLERRYFHVQPACDSFQPTFYGGGQKEHLQRGLVYHLSWPMQCTFINFRALQLIIQDLSIIPLGMQDIHSHDAFHA